ncbi:MAG: hypothetical protein U5L96_17340 [Owenweeksia sp.]|nr:hypothetical protein [Owenweeksia sp.]
MKIKNLKQLDDRIADLTHNRESSGLSFLNSSRDTREVLSSVEQGFYYGKSALKIFRIMTNQHYSPKKRIWRTIAVILTIVGGKLLKNYIEDLLVGTKQPRP